MDFFGRFFVGRLQGYVHICTATTRLSYYGIGFLIIILYTFVVSTIGHLVT